MIDLPPHRCAQGMCLALGNILHEWLLDPGTTTFDSSDVAAPGEIHIQTSSKGVGNLGKQLKKSALTPPIYMHSLHCNHVNQGW